MRVVVVGAGWSGAVVARELHDAGVDVLVVERAEVVGGHSRAEVLNGVVYEPNGAHIFHTSNRRVAEYVQRFGMVRPYEHRVLTEVYLRDDDDEPTLLSWPPQVEELKALPDWPLIERELAELPEQPADAVVVTAPLDDFLGRPGELAWRGIRMVSRYVPTDTPDGTVTAAYVVNRPSERVPYTRTVETKHASGQQVGGTVVSEEHPGAPARHYPVPTVDGRYEERNAELQQEVRERLSRRLLGTAAPDADDDPLAGVDLF
jgi:UDP-galactopyranose mutase